MEDLTRENKKKMNEEKLAEKLHIWYLEATQKIDPKFFNKEAQEPYSELTEEQKFIDRYIAKKIIEKFGYIIKMYRGYQNKHKPSSIKYKRIKLIIDSFEEALESLRKEDEFGRV